MKYEQVQKRFSRYSHLFSKLGRLETMETAKSSEEVDGDDEDDDNQYESEEESTYVNIFEETEREPDANFRVIEVFDGSEWEVFLKTIEPQTSTHTLQAAFNKKQPLSSKYSEWLEQVTKSKLFMESVWLPQVKAMDDKNLTGEDLSEFVEETAKGWLTLAGSVNNRTLSFDRMENVTALEPDTSFLSSCHLSSVGPLRNVDMAYKSFRNLLNIRHLITPFVTALRFFNISNRGAIEELHEFVTSKLINNWSAMTLEEVTRMGIIDTIDKELAIDSERPETLLPIQFIASLVTDEGSSPLIEWLRTKSEQDFEAMGKILQGALFEAYGNKFNLQSTIMLDGFICTRPTANA